MTTFAENAIESQVGTVVPDLDLDLDLDDLDISPQLDLLSMDDDELDEEQRAEKARLRTERRMERVATCGRMHFGVDPRTFKSYRTPWFCGDIRNCQKCRARAAENLKSKVQAAMQTGSIAYAQVDEDRAALLVEQLRRDQYRRSPDESGKVHLFINEAALTDKQRESIANLDIGTTRLTDQNVDTLPWPSIVLTPVGRNKSGSLGDKGKSAPVEAEDKIESAFGGLQKKILAQPVHLRILEFSSDIEQIEFQSLVNHYRSRFMPWLFDLSHVKDQHEAFMRFLAEKVEADGHTVEWKQVRFKLDFFCILPPKDDKLLAT